MSIYEGIKLVTFVTSGIVGISNQIVFWAEIEPVLRKLGHKYDPLSLRKYPNGFYRTLWEYKSFAISQNRSLKWWRVYWLTLWLLPCLFLLWGVI